LIPGVDYECFDGTCFYGGIWNESRFEQDSAEYVLYRVLKEKQYHSIFSGNGKLTVDDLNGGNVQKSFYGKARIATYENGRTFNTYLISYNTAVAMIDSAGRFIRLWNGYSATTAKHIARFMDRYGLRGIGKAEWLNMPIGKPSGIVID
jgi:hypothetical protein